jgi:hypothetical protein
MTVEDHPVARRPGQPAPGKSAAPASGTLATQLEITVILDEPIEKDDKWEVVGGGYRKTLTASDAEPLVKGERILRFKVKPNKNGYKLIHHRSAASQRPIFLENPLPLPITKGTGTQSARDAYAQTDSQVPEKLPDRYISDREVDPDLVEKSPVLVDLEVKDPEIQ